MYIFYGKRRHTENKNCVILNNLYVRVLSNYKKIFLIAPRQNVNRPIDFKFAKFCGFFVALSKILLGFITYLYFQTAISHSLRASVKRGLVKLKPPNPTSPIINSIINQPPNVWTWPWTPSLRLRILPPFTLWYIYYYYF